jgi:hypothetical protein
MNTPFF